MLGRRQLLPSRAHAPTHSRDSPRTSHFHPFLRLSLSSNRRFSSTGTYSTPPYLSITPTHSRTLALTPFAISPVVPSTLALSHLIACALHSPTRQAPNHSTLALRRTIHALNIRLPPRGPGSNALSKIAMQTIASYALIATILTFNIFFSAALQQARTPTIQPTHTTK